VGRTAGINGGVDRDEMLLAQLLQQQQHQPQGLPPRRADASRNNWMQGPYTGSHARPVASSTGPVIPVSYSAVDVSASTSSHASTGGIRGSPPPPAPLPLARPQLHSIPSSSSSRGAGARRVTAPIGTVGYGVRFQGGSTSPNFPTQQPDGKVESLAGLSADELRAIAGNMSRDQLVELSVALSRTVHQLKSSTSIAGAAGAVVDPSYDRVQPSTLLEITELMTSDLGAEKMVDRIVGSLPRLLHAQQVNYFSVLPDSKELVCDASDNIQVVGLRLQYNGIVGYVLKTGRVVNIPDVSKDWRYDELVRVRVRLRYMQHLIRGSFNASGGAVHACSNNLCVHRVISDRVS